ncbi:MAG: hypothetical protein ACREBE_28840 [bacterium]
MGELKAGTANEAQRANWSRAALAELASRGLLLQGDGALPSVVRGVVGGPVRGSWWSHAKAHDIYAVCEFLNDHPDATTAKLILGKVTYVHRALWPALVAVGEALEPWQMEGLSRAALSLLREVIGTGALRAGNPAAARELEQRLLVHVEEVHTERGAHAKQLESWAAWSARVSVPAARPSAADARQTFASHARDFGEARRRLLPWR